VADHVPASSASSATSPPALNYTDAKPAVDPITEEFLNSLLKNPRRRRQRRREK
jgi:hypothetical protein